MTMLPGDWIAFGGMAVVLGALIFGHLRAVHLQRRAEQQRERLQNLLGHPARIARATRDARITEQSWGAR